MPTYDYRCKACKHEFEQFQSMSAKSLTKCPNCGKNALERLIGIGAAVMFKGSGFYQTDYRSENYKKAAEADAKASSGGEKKADGKADSKPDVKADAKVEKKPDAPAETKSETKAERPAKSSTAVRVGAKSPKGSPVGSRPAKKRK